MLKRTNLIISDLKITPVEYANVVQADEKVSSAAGIDSSSKGKKNHEMNSTRSDSAGREEVNLSSAEGSSEGSVDPAGSWNYGPSSMEQEL